jgi:hypothetical protein
MARVPGKISVLCGVLAAVLALETAAPVAQRDAAVTATRLAANPLVGLASSPSLGDDVNGPSVIRVPDWVQRPLGRYYMYFAHHMGDHAADS